MKIVIITPYWLQTKGGIATAVYCLSKELKQNGYSVTVLTSRLWHGHNKIAKESIAFNMGSDSNTSGS
jgi:glycogen synthase